MYQTNTFCLDWQTKKGPASHIHSFVHSFVLSPASPPVLLLRAPRQTSFLFCPFYFVLLFYLGRPCWNCISFIGSAVRFVIQSRVPKHRLYDWGSTGKMDGHYRVQHSAIHA